MDDKYLKLHFSKVKYTSNDAYGDCKTCGDTEEQFIYGIKDNRKSLSYVSYPDLKPRSRFKCSKCYEEKFSKKYKRKASSCKIYHKECLNCEKKFVSRYKQSKHCGRDCSVSYQNKKNLKTYKLSCGSCGASFTSNRKRKYCSDHCNPIKPTWSEKDCETCGITFKASKNDKYCSHECSPWISTPKYRKCEKCNNEVLSPKRICQPCKDRPKPKKPSKVYAKTCPTCDQVFETTTKQKIYCKPSHAPSSVEARKLAKRNRKKNIRKAKLNCESWKDISKYKKSRPSKNHHLDHIIPLNHPDVCGLHNTWNFQWLEKEDNMLKSNKFDFTYDNKSWREKS